MDKDRIELLRRLFVTMTEIIEAASESAVSGQRRHQKLNRYKQAATQLQTDAQNLLALAQAALVVAR